MSSSPGIEWALDKVAELAGGSGGEDPALDVLLALVGALEPVPAAGILAPAARRIGRLRLARALDRPGDLRLGAARLLAALDAPAPAAEVSRPGSLSESPRDEETAAGRPVPAASGEETGMGGRRSSRAADRRIILSFPAPGSTAPGSPGSTAPGPPAPGSTAAGPPAPGSPARAVPPSGQVAAAAHGNDDDEPASTQPIGRVGTISGPHTATVGSTLSLNGSAPPGNGRVTVEGSYDDGHTWETLSSVDSSHGRYATQISLSRRGRLEMRVVFADASSAVGSIVVR